MSKKLNWQAINKRRLFVGGIVFFCIVGIALLIFAGYWFNWNWTGFGEINSPPKQHPKTLWDWLQLLAALLVPVMIAFFSLQFTRQQSQIEQNIAAQRYKADHEIALDNQRESALQNYFDCISELLLEKGLRNSELADEVRSVARVRTVTIFNQLDRRRKNTVLSFLRESGLVTPEIGKSIISFSEANLGEADLECIDLTNIDLSEANLSKANLSGAVLKSTNFNKAFLGGANLSDTVLYNANLSGTNLVTANLSGAMLSGANLSRAFLRKANLTDATLGAIHVAEGARFEKNFHFEGATLRNAILIHADLSRADLGKVDLTKANLKDAILIYASLIDADLSGANLSGANLSNANLSGANLSNANLSGANLNGANLSNANLSGAKLLRDVLNKIHLTEEQKMALALIEVVDP